MSSPDPPESDPPETPDPAAPQTGEEPAAADPSVKEICHLKILAWAAVVLTAVLAVLNTGTSPGMNWLFVVAALASICCVVAAWARARGRGGSQVLALVVAVGLLVYAVAGILGELGRERSVSHAGNLSVLSCLELMLEVHYENTNSFPASLADLESEVGLFPEATIDDFLTYEIPETGEEKPWTYKRISATECTLTSESYKADGKEVTLALTGKEGAVVVVD